MLDSGRVVFVKKVLLKIQYNTLHVMHGFIKDVVMLLASWPAFWSILVRGVWMEFQLIVLG